MNHKEMTAHIRNRIKVAGIKAHVSKYTSCGVNWVRISVPACDVNFSEDEQRTIRRIAIANGLTGPCGLEIDENQHTDPQELHLVYQQAKEAA